MSKTLTYTESFLPGIILLLTAYFMIILPLDAIPGSKLPLYEFIIYYFGVVLITQTPLVFMHELGHVVAGRIVGMDVFRVSQGFISFIKMNSSWRVIFSLSRYSQGETLLFSRSDYKIVERHKFMTLAGPLTSLALGGASLAYLFAMSRSDLLGLPGLVVGAIFLRTTSIGIGTLWPYPITHSIISPHSDGTYIWLLNQPDAMQRAAFNDLVAAQSVGESVSEELYHHASSIHVHEFDEKCLKLLALYYPMAMQGRWNEALSLIQSGYSITKSIGASVLADQIEREFKFVKAMLVKLPAQNKGLSSLPPEPTATSKIEYEIGSFDRSQAAHFFIEGDYDNAVISISSAIFKATSAIQSGIQVANLELLLSLSLKQKIGDSLVDYPESV